MDLNELFTAAAAADLTRPYLTYYDDATGERVELSYATADNWIAKTANLLVDGLGLEPGDRAYVDVPPHWLGGVILLGCWRAGLAISHEPSSVDVAFVSEDRATTSDVDADTTCAVSLAPLAAGLRDADAAAAARSGELLDFLAEVRGHGDHFRPVASPDPASPALVNLPRGGQRDRAQIAEAAVARAKDLDLAEGARVMFTADVLRPLDWLLTPLAAKGSVVLSRNTSGDPTARAASEHARIVQP
ncbi:MAG TPA: TIGR03089 family protein [Stackebrandtia sp.]|uniref:TIGR03089 family protein n=1 Tax=Stackebrandtia sp. TaxID=2023065 RepID=UPI002D5F7061|nr:TIGR03089 family protein [Stackebrandtia sp.]HZE39557.1 TIGR03089 family protein [Stackebrandtia sp.]